MDKQKAIISNIDTKKHNVFWVEPTKRTASSTYEQLKREPSITSKLAYFAEQDYTKAFDKIEGKQTSLTSSSEIILTYAKSAICKANDLAFVNLVIVDCSLFLPNAALNFDNNSDLLDQRRQQSDSINTNLTQIIGRVFRSTMKRIEGQTVIDPRNIVILLHNLPPELQDFHPDYKLLNSYKEFNDTYVAGLRTSQEAISISTSINQALNGDEVTDKGLEQRILVIEKGKKEGLSKLDRRTEREILTEEDVIKIKNYHKELKNS